MEENERKWWESGQDKSSGLQFELYKIAVQTRAQEIDRLWQRSNYLLVLNVAMATALFAIQGKDQFLAMALAVAGLVVSVLWFTVNLGGKYWHTVWEYRTRVIERAIAPNAAMLSADRTQNDKDLLASFNEDEKTEKVGHLRQIQRRLILTRWKPSVSEAITIASLVFVGIWLFAIGLSLVRLFAGGN